ncbi:hypothetical protein A5819_003452 [Enterococcus sp. 7E2_DIV0204]|uniref:hypothetical protein n=1 Tax=unclassified Enterococcus TaxID=2608891 RepID=UPI000B70A5F5|nr:MULTISPECIES: hypothetical protein [unclassified Enterococcus]OTN83719.1 hypothetical protein A5819_003816 [Enterococcus sp. 7E2_DIV0204]OTN86274.1 hypothetical protein A5819_003108 [Enterococcus sp. 7E2_DIV0204]OTN86602.1 hypothetical protein A5819_003452 [Enterococcus sp. 7E2_DIV0204]OTP47609.1 hypothetical protein A5884_003364 [Enterococcus sp. 7D2_DIV0200]OTP48533.1 hypothetical protein A5884_003196 [Enterococcus sp. 7D2_DIV0200]
MGEIIFDKSKKNLKKIYNRINSTSLTKYTRMDEVLFVAIGGYSRTFELLLKMGLDKEDIATFSSLNLSQNFITETHRKKVVYVKKINYVTSVIKGSTYSSKNLDLNIADAFEESMMIYKNAERTLVVDKRRVVWEKPSIVVLDDQSLNLQYDGHRFLYQNEIGFVQIRNRNADPVVIIKELENVEEADRMMFALYQKGLVAEEEILNALTKLQATVFRQVDQEWFMKPTEYKSIIGSHELANAMKDIKELGIYQLTSNKKIGRENARWIVIPNVAFEFTGFEYKDESDLFEEELRTEEQQEEALASQQEQLLQSILSIEIPLNIKKGFVGSELQYSPSESLQSFLDDIDNIEAEKVGGIELLSGATTEQEYKHIKKYQLAYFIDGTFKDNERSDKNYEGGRRLISIDIDDAEYTREEIEKKLESQGLFGLVYPTAKYYFDRSNRWRIILMSDCEMNKEEYKNVVTGVAKMLELEIDEASKKVAQLMGYPLASSDVSMTIGTMVNVDQFRPSERKKSSKVVDFSTSTKSLLSFNHAQAKLLTKVLDHGISEGSRNETYRQIYMYLKDTLDNPEMAKWHEEAAELIERTKAQAILDGLPEKEVEVIYR